MEDIEKLNWHGLERYTNDFKEWILKLFRRAHARMGHIEEDLYNVKRGMGNYMLKSADASQGKIIYKLTDENHPDEYHGQISIDTSAGVVVSVWEECINIINV